MLCSMVAERKFVNNPNKKETLNDRAQEPGPADYPLDAPPLAKDGNARSARESETLTARTKETENENPDCGRVYYPHDGFRGRMCSQRRRNQPERENSRNTARKV